MGWTARTLEKSRVEKQGVKKTENSITDNTTRSVGDNNIIVENYGLNRDDFSKM